MAIIARDTGNNTEFTICPTGLHRAVCCDVVDKGMVPTEWGEKHKIQIRWQVEELRPEDGKPYMIFQSYNLSLHEKSKLRPALESWRGRAFTDEELEGFDLEKLIGVNCQLQIVHNEYQNKIFANAKAIVSAVKGVEPLEVVGYDRVVDRIDGGRATEDDDVVPF